MAADPVNPTSSDARTTFSAIEPRTAVMATRSVLTSPTSSTVTNGCVTQPTVHFCAETVDVSMSSGCVMAPTTARTAATK